MFRLLLLLTVLSCLFAGGESRGTESVLPKIDGSAEINPDNTRSTSTGSGCILVIFKVDRTHRSDFYAYAGGDPVNRVDPNGLFWIYLNGNWTWEEDIGKLAGYIDTGEYSMYQPGARDRFGADVVRGELASIDYLSREIFSAIDAGGDPSGSRYNPSFVVMPNSAMVNGEVGSSLMATLNGQIHSERLAAYDQLYNEAELARMGEYLAVLVQAESQLGEGWISYNPGGWSVRQSGNSTFDAVMGEALAWGGDAHDMLRESAEGTLGQVQLGMNASRVMGDYAYWYAQDPEAATTAWNNAWSSTFTEGVPAWLGGMRDGMRNYAAGLAEGDGSTWRRTAMRVVAATISMAAVSHMSSPDKPRFKLRYRGRDVDGTRSWQSPAGLVYGPDARYGNRVVHVLRHAVDDPSRPGKHGVFSGGRRGVLPAIEDGYGRVLNGEPGIITNTRTLRNGVVRTEHIIPMGRNIGYVGGVEGASLGNPVTRHLMLVLEGKSVITAYPIIP